MSTQLFLLVVFLLPGAIEVEETEAIAHRYHLRDDVVLEDGTRCDLVSAEYAIEVDFSEKWAEGCGQGLYYGTRLGRYPGVLLIQREETPNHLHKRYLERCQAVCKRCGITLWESSEGNTDIRRVYPPDPFQEN